MRIHYLSHSPFPSEAPSSLQVVKTTDALVRKGHGAVVFGFTNPLRRDDVFEFYDVERTFEIVRFTQLGIRGLRMTKYAWQVNRSCRRRGIPDLFYAREAYSSLGCARFGRPLIYEVHAVPHNTFKKTLEGRIFKLKNFMGLVTVTGSLKEYYLEAFPSLSEKNVRVIPNGAQIPSSAEIPKTAGEDIHVGTRVQVGYVGNLTAGRGMETILSLAKANPGMDFHVLGGSPIKLAYWKRQALPSNLRLHGFVPQAGLAGWYDRFDLAVAPYGGRVYNFDKTYEYARWMNPLKLFEYMAHRKAILAADIPAVREILSHGVDAWLVPPDDIDAWNRALKELSAAPSVRAGLAERAFQRFRQNHTWDKRADRILEFLEKAPHTIT